MTDPRSDALVHEYLQRLDRQLATLPPKRRSALREQIEAHINDARAEIPGDEPDAVAKMLFDLGDPSEIVDEAPSATADRRHRRGAVWIPSGVIVVLAVAVLSVAIARLGSPTTSMPPPFIAPSTYVVPSMVHATLDTAMTKLSEHYLTASCRPTATSRRIARVASQSPAGGAKLPPGSVVSLTVIKGSSSHVSTLGVPATIGFQVSCATLLLAGDHVPFRVQWVNASGFWPGAIVAQSRLPSGLVLLRVTRTKTTPMKTSTLPPCTTFKPWATEGAWMLAQESARGGGFGGPDGGIWIYGSIPKDVHGNGTYTLDFGPVPSDFGWGKAPGDAHGFALQWPPDFIAGGFYRQSPTTPIVVTLHGRRYFQVTVTMTKYVPTCSGLTVFVY